MEIEFVTYEIAKKLKELGFDEPCIAHYINELGWEIDLSKGSLYFKSSPSSKNSEYTINAPLWQQAIDWLRVKHNYHIEIQSPDYENDLWTVQVHVPFKFGSVYDIQSIPSYLDAREIGILKTIELCKKNL